MKTIFQLITLIGVFVIIGIPNHADLNNWDILQMSAVILLVSALTGLSGLIAYILPEKKKHRKRVESQAVHTQKYSIR